ncbi:MAG: response regulator [Deltaproteobacteria bacterium]|nr:response regulator [Deltaproteobacteria bacterium]
MVPNNSHRRILVVDDHTELAENLAEILDGEGYLAAVAESAEAALARVPVDEFHALITDFRLPGKSGPELITALHQLGYGFPSLVVSAFTDPQTIAQAHEAGANAVLPKPVDIKALLAALQQVLETGADAALIKQRPAHS